MTGELEGQEALQLRVIAEIESVLESGLWPESVRTKFLQHLLEDAIADYRRYVLEREQRTTALYEEVLRRTDELRREQVRPT